MAWRGTWYLVRKCWRSFRGLFLFSSEPGFLRKTLCCKLTWELRRHLRRYNNEAKWGQWGFTQSTWQWLTLVSSPTPTLLFCVVRNGALIHLCLLIHILWRKKLGLPPGLPSSKSGDPSQHRLCRMGAQSVHRPDHQAPPSAGPPEVTYPRRAEQLCMQQKRRAVEARPGPPQGDGRAQLGFLSHPLRGKCCCSWEPVCHETVTTTWHVATQIYQAKGKKKQGGRRDRVGFILGPDIVTFFPEKCKDMECFPVEPKS